MMQRRALLLVAVCTLALALTASPVGAAVTFQMKVWMLPPMDTTGSGTCLTQRWHSANGHALDWNKNCGSGSADVYFRARAAAIDGGPATVAWAQGEPYQLANPPCGTGTVREARVRIRSNWDGVVKGQTLYAHTLVSTTSAFDIFFYPGDYSTAYYNSHNIGDTKSDVGAGSSCWTGYHAHENNVSSSAWDAFNTIKWNTAATGTEYINNYLGNWTRRLSWVDD